MNVMNLTLSEILELLELFNLDNGDTTLNDLIDSLKNDYVFYDDGEELYFDFLKDETSKDDLIYMFENAISSSYNWDDIVEEMMEDYDNIKEFKSGYVRHID